MSDVIITIPEEHQPVYIAGPMTWIPHFNFPAFDAMALSLRQFGIDVVSPAELDNPEIRAAALASPDGAPGSSGADTWGDFLSRDVKLVADGVGSVAVMIGWEKSRGARLEAFVATLCKKPVYDLRTFARDDFRSRDVKIVGMKIIPPDVIVQALLHSIEP